MSPRFTQWWRLGLLVVLLVLQVVLSVVSTLGPRGLGLLGVTLIVLSLVAARQRPSLGLVLLGFGVVPFAFVNWWSIVVPLVSVLILTVGIPTLLYEASQSTKSTYAGAALERPGALRISGKTD